MLFLATADVGYVLSTLSGIVLGSLTVRKYGVDILSGTTKLFILVVATVIMVGDLY
jgi:hypothetical protein